MQSRHAPPRARIGGLCLPLNSRKPGRAVPAAGETWTGAPGGREAQPLGTQFPLREGGDESGQRCGTGPCRTHEASDISTWERHTRLGTDSGSGSLERAITDPAAPWNAATPGRPSPAYPASVSTSAQWGRGLLCPAPVHPLPGKGPGGLGVVIGGVAGGVWVAGVSLLLGDRGGGALLF